MLVSPITTTKAARIKPSVMLKGFVCAFSAPRSIALIPSGVSSNAQVTIIAMGNISARSARIM